MTAWDSNPGSHSCKPSVRTLIHSTIPLCSMDLYDCRLHLVIYLSFLWCVKQLTLSIYIHIEFICIENPHSKEFSTLEALKLVNRKLF